MQTWEALVLLQFLLNILSILIPLHLRIKMSVPELTDKKKEINKFALSMFINHCESLIELSKPGENDEVVKEWSENQLEAAEMINSDWLKID